MNERRKKRIVSLEELREEKRKVKEEIQQCSDRIKLQTHSMFGQQKATSKLGSFMATFDKGLAIAQGVFWGYRILGRLRGSFRR